MTIAFICTLIYYRFFKYRYFKVVKATCHNWTKSKKDDDIVTYRIQIIAKRPSEELKLDALWIDNKRFRVRIISEKNQEQANDFSSKDALYIEAERQNSDITYEEMAPSKKGKISLGYLINDKRKYISVKPVEEKFKKFFVAS